MTDLGDQTVRQRQREATARSIEGSAVALVLEHGLEGVTVDMICEAAGVSQRTFFNYFKTKDAAILGAQPPALDERRVREFLASDSPDLLPDVMGLLMSLAPAGGFDFELVSARMQIVTKSPVLMQKEMSRLLAVRDELEEILFLRMRRSAAPDESPENTRDQAALITHLMAGILRFSVERRGEPGGPATPARIQELLRSVLPKLTFGNPATGP
jgi:AcrR family transcriptional regulator